MNQKPLTLTGIEALLRAGQLEEAHQSLRDYVKRDPGDAQGWYMLGNLYRRQQLWGDAINHLNRAKLLDPDGPADAAIESIYDILRFVNKDLMNP
jgi:cytochrome c-type biogenesis protein CcmH/NrfG